jgi:soluble lytic murein transglycosylase
LKVVGVDQNQFPARGTRRKAARRLTVAALAVGVAAVATAQPVPYTQLGPSPVTPAAPYAGIGAGATESGVLRDALNAAKAGDVARARAASANLADPLARRLALWALVDSSAGRAVRVARRRPKSC